MKSIHGRGMARGYAAGRAHIRELNRRNAELLAQLYVGQFDGWDSKGMEVNVYLTHGVFAPEQRAEAERIAFKESGHNKHLFYRIFTGLEIDQRGIDPEGVARLKANPKL